MIKLLTLLFFSLLTFCSCNTGTNNSSINTKVEEKIKTVLAEQQDCWNKGDIDCFMQGYWNSDSLRFIGKSGVNYGWQATLDNYKKSYPNKVAMGTLNFDILHLELIGENHYLVTGK